MLGPRLGMKHALSCGSGVHPAFTTTCITAKIASLWFFIPHDTSTLLLSLKALYSASLCCLFNFRSESDQINHEHLLLYNNLFPPALPLFLSHTTLIFLLAYYQHLNSCTEANTITRHSPPSTSLLHPPSSRQDGLLPLKESRRHHRRRRELAAALLHAQHLVGVDGGLSSVNTEDFRVLSDDNRHVRELAARWPLWYEASSILATDWGATASFLCGEEILGYTVA